MRKILMALAATAGVALAALTGLASGQGGHTLASQQNVKDTRLAGKLETVAVYHGLPVYYLSGDRKKHPLCTQANGCFNIWKPVTVSSKSKLSKTSEITGKLGVWNRNGFHQVMLAGHPLYTFHSDTKGVANGDTIPTFGGTWHLILAASSGTSGTQTSTPGTTTMTTTTPTCLYPPCY